MESRELRIGNYVKDRGGKTLRIDYWENKEKIAMDMGSYETGLIFCPVAKRHPLTEDIEYLQPIKLTEEWLLKFGFEKKFDNYSLLDWRFHINKPANYEGFLLCEGYSVITDRINYVHQLQNLYYSLVGEELEINSYI